MNHSRKLLKRVIAIKTAASFVTVGGDTALAAGSYREAETAAYDNFVAGTASLWNDYLENYQKALTGSKAVSDLKLEDTGKLLDVYKRQAMRRGTIIPNSTTGRSLPATCWRLIRPVMILPGNSRVWKKDR